MTFTKEKLDMLNGALHFSQDGFTLWSHEKALIVEAAQALPKYIAALEEAERALEFYANEQNWRSGEQVNYDEHFDTPVAFKNDRHGKNARSALTTIRQLAMGNAQ